MQQRDIDVCYRREKESELKVPGWGTFEVSCTIKDNSHPHLYDPDSDEVTIHIKASRCSSVAYSYDSGFQGPVEYIDEQMRLVLVLPITLYHLMFL